MFEIELHFPATETEDASTVLHYVEASCPTELSNIAYRMQMKEGYRTVKNILTGKVRVVGLKAEYVSFGPVIQRGEDGLPLLQNSKKHRNS